MFSRSSGYGTIPPQLRTEELSVRYRTRRVPTLQNVSLSIPRGERLLVAGPSGSGKSTLGLALSGLIPLSIDADITGTVDPGESTIGTVFQDPSTQFAMLTVEDEVAFGLENMGIPQGEMANRIGQALTSVGLAPHATSRIDRLSGGQQQRLALASVLAMRPNTLILDETVAFLDPRSAAEVYCTVSEIAATTGMTLLVVEHDVDVVVPGLIRQVAIMGGDGALAANGTPAEVFSHRESARRWAREGLRLPAPASLVMALDDGSTDRLPLGEDEASNWLAQRPEAQQRLRRAAEREKVSTPGDQPLVDADRISHRYKHAAGEQVTLRGIDLQVSEGETVALVGRNGSGKTTLLRALSGCLPLDKGQVYIDNRVMSDRNYRSTFRPAALVFQNPELGFVANTVEDELSYGLERHGWNTLDIAHRVESALSSIGLSGLAKANPFTLSQGQKRRLSISAAMISEPHVLLLDEPTSGQDERSYRVFIDTIVSLRARGLAIVIATHDTNLIADVADRVVALSKGEVVFNGSVETFFNSDDILAEAGQVQPILLRILNRATRLGAQVPTFLRPSSLLSMGTIEGRVPVA